MREVNNRRGSFGPIFVFLLGLLMLELGGFGNAFAAEVKITSPTYDSVVRGLVAIKLLMKTGVATANVYIDGVYLASTPDAISWNSTDSLNGTHIISARAFDTSGTLLGTASKTVRVKNAAPTPTATATPAPGQVKITSPANGATVSGTVSIAAQYSSPVSWVNFYIDGTWVASSPPSTLSWNSTGVANGSHTVTVNGYNSSNTQVATTSISLNVQNGGAPSPIPTSSPTPTSGQLTITSPANGATVSGTVSIAAQYSSPVSWLNFYVDGTWVASSPPSTMAWNSTGVANGSHSVTVNGYNSSNALVATAGISLNVQNGVTTATPTRTPTITATFTQTPTPAPTPTPSGTVKITSPASGATVSGTVSIVAQYASPISWLNFYIDGTWVASSPPATMSWNSASVANGSHTIAVNGYNSSNALVATTAINVTVKNGSSTPTPTTKPSATPSSTATPFYSLVPAGSALPSDSQCAAGVAGDTFEPRPVNAVPNATTPSASDLTTYKSEASGGEGGAPGSFLVRADGQFTGTTDAILKWASCKWGFDENVTRATAVNETHWRQLELGDIGNGTSIGILQIKSRDYPSTCESVASSQNTADVTNPDCYSYLSTAFAADYKLAQQRACFEGQVSYLTSDTPSSGYPTYPNGTPDQMMWGCVGWWYSGHWYDSGALNYISQVQSYLSAQTWAQPGF